MSVELRAPELALDRRRVVTLAAVCWLLALAGVAVFVLVLVQVAERSRSAWLLALLPAPTSLVVIGGVTAYALTYFAATGRRWPMTARVNAAYRRLHEKLL